MSILKNFDYTPVHAHLALLGWGSLGLAGFIYILYSKAEQSKRGKAHFGLPIPNIGFPS
ncbi:hypothetical protein [Calidifontibacillus erzurumensis]|uniref:hypothetical protein n=1 Tax=Calidifontibacillus erzurumensis TaxID=2741433 RepID=UPI002E795E99|nr:hypothetical protein [Calidifontibacillus erzurumensis]